MPKTIVDTLSRKEWLVLGLLYVVATAININKAYHIDDTFHLEAANWIRQHPLTPMSGQINWDQNKEPMYVANQPPLYFYMLALVSALFGNSEIVMHLFQSVFTFFALYFFYRITQILNLKHGLLLTALLAFCPAFLINQNLMVDVPLVCLNLWFLYYLLKPDESSETARYWKAGLVLSMSLLIKYSNLPLVVVLLATLLWRKQYRLLYTALIPVAALGLWSLWNYWEFSAIHIVGRPRPPMTFAVFSENVSDYVTCLGAISPFAFAFYAGYLSRYRLTTLLIPFIGFLFVGLTIATAKDRIFFPKANDILAIVFLINGLLIIVLVIASLWRHNFVERKTIDVADVILFLWILGVSGFIILFAPFVASRHVLLIIAPVLFVGGRWLDNISVINGVQAVLAAAAITLILAVSDWQYADFYRRTAKEVVSKLPQQSRIWTVGHWGWQWYSQQNGMQEIQADSMQMQTNDYLARPSGLATQEVPKGYQLQPAGYVTLPFNWSVFVSTSYYVCFYGQGAAWAYSKFPIDTIKLYRVTGVPIKQNIAAKRDIQLN